MQLRFSGAKVDDAASDDVVAAVVEGQHAQPRRARFDGEHEVDDAGAFGGQHVEQRVMHAQPGHEIALEALALDERGLQACEKVLTRARAQRL